jgi:hypothetical protein
VTRLRKSRQRWRCASRRATVVMSATAGEAATRARKAPATNDSGEMRR